MSGHSHWATVKRKKTATDAKRGQVFSKLAKTITVAAKEKGGDPEMNPKLRLAIEQARSLNMPSDNIERAIKKGTGEIKDATIEEATYEAYGPGGIPLIIEVITDNKNRTLAEIKSILNRHNGKIADEGSVRWGFEQKGIIEVKSKNSEVKSKEEVELKIIDAGADDIRWQDRILEVYTSPENLEKVKKNLEEQEFEIESANLGWAPKEEVKLEDEKLKNNLTQLFEELDANDDVQEIYSNIKWC